MTREIGDVLVIEAEPDRECELCHERHECRPYGPHGEQVCFRCANLPENAATTRAAMEARLARVEKVGVNLAPPPENPVA